MKKIIILLLLGMQALYACEVTDDTGTVIHLQQPATRIISLSPDLTEILFSVGAGKNIVGVMKGNDYPSSAKSLPVVADYNGIDIETVLALHPDLIVVWSEYRPVKQLKKLAIPMYVSHPEKITDIAKTIRRLGYLTGNEKEAEKIANQFLQHYHALKIKYEHKKSVSVFYQVWSRPLITITKKSWINEIISVCGGKNIFADLQGVSPSVSMESVVVLNPDVIMGADLQSWSQWKNVSAVRFNHVYTVNADLIERAGPRMLEGVEEVCRALNEVRE